MLIIKFDNFRIIAFIITLIRILISTLLTRTLLIRTPPIRPPPPPLAGACIHIDIGNI